jgi:hypothetical protein
MMLLLILAQIALVFLQFVAHTVNLDLWVVFLPVILLGSIVALASVLGYLSGHKTNIVFDQFFPFA